MEDTLSVLDLAVGEEGGLYASGLTKLPLEIRQEIWGYVLGRERNSLIVIESKLRAVPSAPSSTPAQRCHEFNPFFESGDLEKYGAPFRSNRVAILRTCRQIYIEAVELLYSNNEFVFMNGNVWNYFVNAIKRKRLDAIRHMRIYFGEADWLVLFHSAKPRSFGDADEDELRGRGRECIIRPLSPYSSYQATRRQEWHSYWETIAGMQRLTSLHVEIRYTLSYMFGDADGCYGLLLPLLQLRGIDLKFKLENVHCGRGGRSDGFAYETKELVKRIERTARLPRGVRLEQEEEKRAGNDVIRQEIYPRRQCSCDLMPKVTVDYTTCCCFEGGN